MQHSNELIEAAVEEKSRSDASANEGDGLLMADRSAPRWALIVALFYTALTASIYIAAAIVTVFLFDLVAVDGQQRLAPMLVAAMSVPLLGTILIDYAYRWSLSGLRDVRTAVADRAAGILGLIGVAIMTFVQPFFLLPIAITLIIAILGLEGLRRFDRREDAWDFRSEEATSFLSGRDNFGFNLATQKRSQHSIAGSFHRFAVVFSGLSSFALGSWLIAENVLTLEAVASLSFISMLTVDMVLRAARSFAFDDVQQPQRDTVVLPAVASLEDDVAGQLDRLSVKNLSVTDANDHRLLDNISFDAMPGSIVQITGSSGDGKSLLLQALSDPFSIDGCKVQGHISFSGIDFWDRRPNNRSVPAVRVDACPLILPASAQDNITCFQPEANLDRAKSILRKIVYSEDVINQMTSAEVHAPLLPLMQQKVLGIVRAFLISPQVILLDCPEAFLPERQIGQVVELLKAQSRLGRVSILISENRALIEACDKVLVLQGGRAVDFGEGTEIRARHGSGWRRFKAPRRLDTEEALHSWLRSQFIRNGDEGNRRRVCNVGSNILAHFCLSCPPDDDADIMFECKQKAGAMELRVSDDMDPISTVQFEQARLELDGSDMGSRLTPLAQVIRDSIDVKTDGQFGKRDLLLEIETYDPRKRAAKAD